MPTTTTLRVTEAGVVLARWHRERLGPSAFEAFDAFAASAVPGIYRIIASPGAFEVTQRNGSALVPNLPLRWLPSPLADGLGPIAKPLPNGPYASVRLAGTTTLLTVENGRFLAETCVAALVGWRDGQFIAPLPSHTRVKSVALAWLGAVTDISYEGLAVDGSATLVALNAVGGIVPLTVAGRKALPEKLASHLNSTLLLTAKRAPEA